MKGKISDLYFLILGILIFGTISVSAAIMLQPDEVDFISDKTSQTTVKGALDELYELSRGECPEGHICVTCGVGTYANQTTMECVTCPSGYTSESGAGKEADCYIQTTAGKYIETANSATQTNCSVGSYCPSEKVNYGNVGKIVSCPEGYTSAANATKESDCYIQTTAGKYISTANSATQTDCPSGSYCTSTKVYYGNTGGISTCPSIYTNSAASSTQASNCYTTTSGGQYIASAYSSTKSTCPSGSYCPSATIYYGSTGDIRSCGSGYTSSSGSSSSSSCYSIYVSCPSGYTSNGNVTSTSQCYIQTTAGKYIKTARSSTQTNCPSGSYCPSTKVYYGDTGGISSCPSGYGNSASNSTTQSDCYLTTTAGKYIATANSSTQTQCPANSYCPSATIHYGSTGSINSCGSGKTSPAGSDEASDCISSTYTYTKTATGYTIKDHSGIATGTWTATYTCNNGTATITSCHFSGSKGSATCDGGTLGTKNYKCINSDASDMGAYCNMSLIEYFNVTGAGFPETESCS